MTDMSVLGSVLGLAYGDSIGKDVEFQSYRSIVSRYGPLGPSDLARHGQVTDDTQMMIAVGEALVAVRGQMSRRARRAKKVVLRPADVEAALVGRFVNWLHDPENNRAPGGTCLTACRSLSEGRPWWEATIKRSKGCGANMRVTVVGLCDWLSAEERSAVAQFQAALTHAHPTALAAADATQHAVWLLRHGTTPDRLLSQLEAYCFDRVGAWHQAWLGELWAWTGEDESAGEYLHRGWGEVLRAVRRVAAELTRVDRGDDVCRAAGEAWSAEEALAAGLLSFLRHEDDAVMAVRRGATSNGDSDSIAAIAGALAGAYHGAGGFPLSWRARVEYHSRLKAMAAGLQ